MGYRPPLSEFSGSTPEHTTRKDIVAPIISTHCTAKQSSVKSYSWENLQGFVSKEYDNQFLGKGNFRITYLSNVTPAR